MGASDSRFSSEFELLLGFNTWITRLTQNPLLKRHTWGKNLSDRYKHFIRNASLLILVIRRMLDRFFDEASKDSAAGKGTALLDSGKHREGTEELKRASKENPDNWYVWRDDCDRCCCHIRRSYHLPTLASTRGWPSHIGHFLFGGSYHDEKCRLPYLGTSTSGLFSHHPTRFLFAFGHQDKGRRDIHCRYRSLACGGSIFILATY